MVFINRIRVGNFKAGAKASSLFEHDSLRQVPLEKTRRKVKSNKVLPTRKALPPPLHGESVIVLSNGATYPTQIGHPAFTPGKIVLQNDRYNVLKWENPKILKSKKETATNRDPSKV